MKISVKTALRWGLLAVAALFAAVYISQQVDTVTGAQLYDKAAELAFSGEATDTTPAPQPSAAAGSWVVAPVEEEDPYITQLQSVDFDALREVNPDVIGWILIPGGDVNYPIMKGKDNDEYLRRAWNGKRNYVGSIFLEEMNHADLSDYNTIVYGHNMNNGDMFGQLRNYQNSSYRKQNPYIYLATDAGVYRYEVFSVYQAGVESDTYRVIFNDAKHVADFLVHALKSDTGNYGIFPEPNDRILTLSTCTEGGYSRRYVVQAHLPMVKVVPQAADTETAVQE